jgi:hypothetical protein
VLVPCFWQSRVQAGDLGSHIYNAWLAQLIGQGQAPGLRVMGQTTNVLFDLLLGALFQACGAAAAQRIAVSVAVLVFFWGAFAFVAAVARRPWPMAPALAMLGYGWVFHMGFFNFYLSLGLCFWALALAWDARPRGRLLAVPLLALAYLAHGLPVVWDMGVLAYAWLWRRLTRRARGYLLGASLAALVLMRAAVVGWLRTRWYTGQIWHITGADQLCVYGGKYRLAACVLLAVWIGMAIERRRGPHGAGGQGGGALPPILMLTAACIFVIPNVIWIRPDRHQLAYISERMSLPLGIAVCALLAGAPARAWQRCAMAAVTLLFFGFLFADERALNDFEDQLDRVVARIPPGQRVLLSVDVPGSQVNALAHMIDRACIGRCWSYANYEPPSGDFRIRIVGATSLIAPTDGEASRLEDGSYVVKPNDLPLAQIRTDGAGRLVVRHPPPGKPIGMTRWNGL